VGPALGTASLAVLDAVVAVPVADGLGGCDVGDAVVTSDSLGDDAVGNAACWFWPLHAVNAATAMTTATTCSPVLRTPRMVSALHWLRPTVTQAATTVAQAHRVGDVPLQPLTGRHSGARVAT